jgi:hypothetical protein
MVLYALILPSRNLILFFKVLRLDIANSLRESMHILQDRIPKVSVTDVHVALLDAL